MGFKTIFSYYTKFFNFRYVLFTFKGTIAHNYVSRQEKKENSRCFIFIKYGSKIMRFYFRETTNI